MRASSASSNSTAAFQSVTDVGLASSAFRSTAFLAASLCSKSAALRNTSATLRAAVFGQETDEVFLPLLVIEDPDITTIRVVDNEEDITSNGDVYTAFPFQISLPPDSSDGGFSVRLTICNVDRTIIDEIRTLTRSPTITLSIILASDPDTIEAGPIEMTLGKVDWDALVIIGTLQTEDILNEPYPGEFFTPNLFPGLF